MSEPIENKIENQEVNAQSAPSNFQSNGCFAPGNKIHELSSRGKGFQKPSWRLEMLLNTVSVRDINKKIYADEIDDLPVNDSMNMRKLLQAGQGDTAATNFVYDKLEPKEQGAAVRVNVNNAISNNQSQSVSESMDLVRDIIGSAAPDTPGEPVPG